MKLFPYHKTTISTNLTSAQINLKLKTFVEFDINDKLFSNKFYGEVGKNSFSIYKGSYLLSMVLVKINGKIVQDTDKKNQLTLIFLLAEVPFVLFLLMMISMVMLFVFTLIYTPSVWLKLTPLAAMIFAYLIFNVPFYLIVSFCKEFIIERLEAREITR